MPKQRRGHSQENPRHVESRTGLSITESTGRRQNAILLAALLGTLVVIAVVVALTPLDEEDILDSNQRALDEFPAASTHNPTGRGNPPHNGESAIGSSLTAEPPRVLKFPTESVAIDVASVQKELRALAVYLQTEYANDPVAFHFAAQIFNELNQSRDAEASWRRSIGANVQAAGPYAGLAELLVQAGRAEEALEVLATAESNGTESLEIFQIKVNAHEASGSLEDALSVAESGLERFPKNAELWLSKGRLCNQLRNYEQAEVSLKAHLALAGNSENALFLLSTAQIRQKKKAEAAETRKLLAELRESAHSKPSEFQKDYESALRKITVEVLVSAASLAIENSRWDDAERFLWRSLELNPNSGPALMSLSTIMRQRNQMRAAVQIHQRLIEVQPNNLLNYSNLASIALQAGQWELAEKTLKQAEEKDAQGFIAQASLAKFYLAQQRYAQALEYAKLVIDRQPTVESYLLLAAIEESIGNPTAAASAIQQARSIDPNHPVWQAH